MDSSLLEYTMRLSFRRHHAFTKSKSHAKPKIGPFFMKTKGLSCHTHYPAKLPLELSNAKSSGLPVTIADRLALTSYFDSTPTTRTSGICIFQFPGIASKINRNSLSSPGFSGAAPTGCVSI